MGTELLLGQIVNSNAATIAQRLAAAGLDAHYQTTVGDNLQRLTGAIADAAARGRRGGADRRHGPHPRRPDPRRVVRVRGVPASCATRPRSSASATGCTRPRGSVTESALRMADYPEGADPLPNPVGVALGAAMEHDGVHLFALPGVPSEMVAMLDAEVMPRLRALVGEPAVLRSRLLQTVGLGESQVAELLGDLNDSTNPSLAYMLTDNQTRVRISAKAATDAAADALIDEMETAVVARLGAARGARPRGRPVALEAERAATA